MRRYVLVLSVFVAALLALPQAVRAQFLFQETVEPRVDAAQESWQINGEPIFVDGLVYYPSGPDRFFDGNVMSRTGSYRGIPVYQDRTIEPYSIVYVPMGRRLMRPYERRRTGELAGTVGSHAPSFPVATSSPLEPTPTDADIAAGAVGTAGAVAAPQGNTYVKSANVVITNATSPSITTSRDDRASNQAPTRLESVPAPAGPNGIYIEFEDARWYGSGSPMTYAADNFTPIGNYAGFVVYRMKNDAQARVWVPVVEGGPLAQYSKR
jgi:hypothetical protein